MLNNKLSLQKAFTLIELLVVVAVIGILAAIAYPSYQDSMTKARRADAKGALLGFANAMERHFTEGNTYLGAGTDSGNTGAPTIYSTQSPVEGGDATYNLTINAVTQTSYTLYATKTGAQANDKCGTLTLDQTGTRDIVDADTGVVKADCW